MSILMGILMALVPFVVVPWVRRNRKLPWGPLFLGAGMFLLAQALKFSFFPLLAAVSGIPVLLAFVSALAPGIWEEVTKWAPLKWITRPTGWDAVLAFGIGFGGIECIYLGLNVVAVVAMTAQGVAMPSSYFVDMVKSVDFSPVGIALVLLSVFERVCVVALHTWWAVLNAQAIRTGRLRWFGAAILAHTVVDFGAALYQQAHLSGLGLLVIEVPIGFVAWFAFQYIRRTVQTEWKAAAGAPGVARAQV